MSSRDQNRFEARQNIGLCGCFLGDLKDRTGSSMCSKG